MQTQELSEGKKAVVIEIMDVFLNMGVEEIPENYPEDKEREAHIKTINEVLRRAKSDGFNKYALYTREEAEARGQDLGLNGLYLVVLKK